ncbi:hypothetical protein [Fimbriiglobus ruber]|uniref:Uncharacterized protein n=1 Tax=Fimbriiglobus ruber TaxID=1908690 RepID=A0A225E2Q3_9BACT|nr:hypothetical protein [Fimbriiglobus ruber]OWK45068.1 hypothetical protein FRUB_01399 [Fimbriiglobus ruber]
MKEDEWLTWNHTPRLMLGQRGVRNRRKRQLVAAAGCRLVWDRFRNPAAIALIDALERYTDDRVADHIWNETRARVEAEITADQDAVQRAERPGLDGTLQAVAAAAHDDAVAGVDRAVDWLESTVRQSSRGWREQQAALAVFRRQVSDIIREIFGNPFRPWKVVPDFLGGGLVQPDGATVRLTTTARELARGIAHDQAFDRLPILADALEEAGVTDIALLAHCRSGGPHARGCWAVDLVLGKV